MQIKFKQPANTTNRIETDPIVFNDNCKGIFIRGDNYAFLNICLTLFLEQKYYNNLNASECINKILRLLEDKNYDQIQTIDEDITAKSVGGITYIHGYGGTFSNINSMSFGPDWDGTFIEKTVCTEIYNTLLNLEMHLEKDVYYYLYFKSVYSIFKYVLKLYE